MPRTQEERLAEKTVERQFLYELEKDFELAPATSRALLETAQQVLLLSSQNGAIREGQMRVTAVSVSEPSGKPLSAMRKVGVVVTVDAGLSDLEVWERYGGTAMRRARLLRVTEEAVDQDGVLTQEDLARLLQTDVRTIRRDVAGLRAAGHWVPTRGTIKEIGRGPVAQGQDRGDVSAADDVLGDHAQGATRRQFDQALRGDLWTGGGLVGSRVAAGARDRVRGGRERTVG